MSYINIVLIIIIIIIFFFLSCSDWSDHAVHGWNEWRDWKQWDVTMALLPARYTGMTQELNTHDRDKWVCGTETNTSSPSPNFILLCYIAECGLSGSSGQAHNLKIWKVCLGHALDPKPCSLACWTHSIRIQQKGVWKGIGEVIIEMLVSVLQTR